MKLSKVIVYSLIGLIPFIFLVNLISSKANNYPDGKSYIEDDTSSPNYNDKSAANSVTLTEDGKQIISIKAKGGYWPRTIKAKANTDTILKVITQNTIDCSAALSIPSLKYYKVLPSSGSTEVSISPQKNGTVLDGTCSMGMYSFRISFYDNP